MRKNKKKTYQKPVFKEVILDQTILLQYTSQPNEYEPPGPPRASSASIESNTSGEGASETEEVLKQNKFDDNPFQR